MSTIIGAAFFFIFVVFIVGAYFTMPAEREFVEQRPVEMCGLAIAIFAAAFGLSLPWTVGMAFRSSSRNE